ncbi:hypothetical protein [Desulfovibrio inopinatus]|uniref:hypothetical protein n=1 Tax=Desulfovibrio inopinatus TaxID=102109 RepID=UPI0004107FF8|nr:hypothetical protein [Desulfovibrio inopinatus]
MSTELEQKAAPRPEQITYANLLQYGAWTGIVLMLITYTLYMAGVLEPHVPIDLVVTNWNHGIHEYIAATNSPVGWEWLALLDKGDFVNFIGLALLAVMTIICYLVLLPGYLKRGNKIYATICILEILVLCLAASGILGSGGH